MKRGCPPPAGLPKAGGGTTWNPGQDRSFSHPARHPEQPCQDPPTNQSTNSSFPCQEMKRRAPARGPMCRGTHMELRPGSMLQPPSLFFYKITPLSRIYWGGSPTRRISRAETHEREIQTQELGYNNVLDGPSPAHNMRLACQNQQHRNPWRMSTPRRRSQTTTC